MSVCRNDPLLSLNYAIFLYNTGDKAAAARQFHNFEKRYEAVASSDVDAEVMRWLALLSLFVLILYAMHLMLLTHGTE